MNTATNDTSDNASRSDKACRYMWLITVQWPTSSGFSNATFYSTVLIAAGASRLDILNQVRELAMRETGADSLTVLHFSLEPDRLAA